MPLSMQNRCVWLVCKSTFTIVKYINHHNLISKTHVYICLLHVCLFLIINYTQGMGQCIILITSFSFLTYNEASHIRDVVSRADFSVTHSWSPCLNPKILLGFLKAGVLINSEIIVLVKVPRSFLIHC